MDAGRGAAKPDRSGDAIEEGIHERVGTRYGGRLLAHGARHEFRGIDAVLLRLGDATLIEPALQARGSDLGVELHRE